ncbi:hypothetical protein ACF0H5_004773 [Mactra antiquata]
MMDETSHEWKRLLDEDSGHKQESKGKYYMDGNVSDYDKLGARPKSSVKSETNSKSDTLNNKTSRNKSYSRKFMTNKDCHKSHSVGDKRCYDKKFLHDMNLAKVTNRKTEDKNDTEMTVKPAKSTKEIHSRAAKENRVKRKPSRVTHMFVVLTEKFYDKSKIKEFLKHRMGNPKLIDFDVSSTNNIKNDKTASAYVINLQFESHNKALVARRLLNSSNKGSSSKIQSFLSKDEAEGKHKQCEDNNDKKMEKAIEEILIKVRAVLYHHNEKIEMYETSLDGVEKQLHRRRGVSLDEFEKLTCEKEAFNDKLQELKSQKDEYLNYVSSMNAKLKSFVNDKKFEEELKKVRTFFGVECQRLKTALPIYARREDILTTIANNQVTVILGETGSGKSTQIAPFVFEAGYAAKGLVACTQPRKIAAISLATKVASDLASRVGQIVGYKVGMQSKTCPVTKIVYMTDHILLNECLSDRDLMRYSCIIIDEAHERSIHTDLLLGMLKECLERRPELRVIVTSATIDPQLFVDYFGGKCPVLKVSGRMFPVDVIWNQDDNFDSPFPEDYEEKAVGKAVELHVTTPKESGDILVFLTAVMETEKAVQKFMKRVNDKDVLCLQMHGRLKPEEQGLVLAPTPRGKRKVVFATNNAETSLTIPGITYVVDTGVVKEMVFDPRKNISALSVVKISQSSANQRKGRAGRTRSGECYRLYSEKDYNNMDKISKPEILRVQVSQAMLKLLVLGVDPMRFQYVQAPSVDSMKSAFEELIQLGAVVDNNLSDLGNWISKMPFEPKLGAFVKKGIDSNVLMEALVVASCCNQSNLFFRVGSQEEKKNADMKKVRFCHSGGDLLTMLNVYREWDQQNEKKKGKWCADNSINGKSLKAVRDMVNEVVFILKKEYNMQIKHSFGDADVVDSKVQHLIFDSMSSNLGYYLGHDQAGYMIPDRMERVKLHPSSSLHMLGLHPTWIVFSKSLKTSDDFLTDVTPVALEAIEDAVKNKRIFVDLKAMERQKVKISFQTYVGRHVFWKFVGNMHTNRKTVETNISKKCGDSMIIVEANKQTGKITLFSLPQYESNSSNALRSILSVMPEQVAFESREEMIGNGSGTRALLGIGGRVLEILKPDEFRSVMVLPKTDWLEETEEEIRSILDFYGPIESIWAMIGKKRNRPFWGKVTFVYSVDAQAAVDGLNDDEESQIRLKPVTFENQRATQQRKPEFTMKLTWCRRKARGLCFVEVKRPEDLASLVSNSFELNDSTIYITLARNGSDLFLKGIGSDIMEEEIKAGLADLLDANIDDIKDRVQVRIPRQNVVWSENERLEMQQELSKFIVDQFDVDEERFRVHVREFKPQTVICVAFVTFDDPQICQKVGEGLIEEDFHMRGSSINVCLDCKSNVVIDKNLYPKVKQDLDNLLKTLKRSQARIDESHLKSGALRLNITAPTIERLTRIKVQIDGIVGDDTLECEDTDNLHHFFNNLGRQTARSIEYETKTIIFLDERNMKITVKGPLRGRTDAIMMIRRFLSSYDKSVEKTTRLKGDDLPVGIMKSLLVKYGVGFEQLLEETGVTKVHLHLKQHEMTITGEENAVAKALDIIANVKNEINNEITGQCDTPDCPICLCPIEEHEISRLEYCGHPYCSVCLISMILNSVTHKELPVKCAKDGCDQPLVIRDFNALIRIGKLKPVALLNSALSCFIAENKDTFRFCITPDCSMIYPVSEIGYEEVFICPICHVKICTSCHMQSHDGITCSMYQSAKLDGESVLTWLAGDPDNRKLCPKCNTKIEKNGGCQNVHCTSCKAYICWRCMKHFTSDQLCYKHLRKVHGSFV